MKILLRQYPLEAAIKTVELNYEPNERELLVSFLTIFNSNSFIRNALKTSLEFERSHSFLLMAHLLEAIQIRKSWMIKENSRKSSK